jgi:predicted permease
MVSQSAPVIGTAQEHLWTSVFRPEVFRAALMAIWQMSLFLILGSILHRIHVLDVHTVQGLSKAVYHIFLPALCFVNISAEAASGHYASMVTLLLAASIHIAIGIAAGEVLSHWMKIPERKRRLVKIACGFGNSTALPALFYNSIFASDPSRASSCLGLMSIYCIMWTAAFWPYFHANFSASIGDANQQENGAESVDSRSRSSGIGIEASTTDKSALLHSGMFLWAARRLESVFYALGTPPAFASIVGLLVGLLSPLRSFLYGNNQVISVGLLRTLKTLAAANGACALLVLAASLATKVPKSQTEPADEFIDSNGSSSLAESGGGLAHPLDAVLGLYRRARRLFRSADLGILLPALITRCVLLPCVSLAIVFPLANHFRLFPDGLAGQLLRFVILLQGVMPPAQNIVIGLQLEGDRNEATYASRQLLVIYLVSLLPLSLLLTFFLGALHI